MKRIYDKKTLKLIGQIQNNTTFEWEIENNVIPNFGGEIEDYSVIESNFERFHLEKKESGEVIVIEDVLTIEEQKQDILKELDSLDYIVPRVIEDIIIQGDFSIHQSKQIIIDQKNELRNKLQKLETEV